MLFRTSLSTIFPCVKESILKTFLIPIVILSMDTWQIVAAPNVPDDLKFLFLIHLSDDAEEPTGQDP